MVKARGDGLTGDLLTWEPPKVAAGFEPGAIRGNRLASQICQSIKLALDGYDRPEIARRMSDELGKTVSANMLDNYASEGAEAHKITLERFVALMEATGCIDALAFVAERLGHIIVPARYRDVVQAIVEVDAIDRHQAELARAREAATAKSRGMR